MVTWGHKLGHKVKLIKIPCGRSRGHISCSGDLKIIQNVCLDENSYKFEFGSPGIIN